MGLNHSPCLKKHKGIKKTHGVYGVHLVKAINDLDDLRQRSPKWTLGAAGEELKICIHQAHRECLALLSLCCGCLLSHSSLHPLYGQSQRLPKFPEGKPSCLSRTWLRNQATLWSCSLICSILELICSDCGILGCPFWSLRALARARWYNKVWLENHCYKML